MYRFDLVASGKNGAGGQYSILVASYSISRSPVDFVSSRFPPLVPNLHLAPRPSDVPFCCTLSVGRQRYVNVLLIAAILSRC